MPPFSTTAINSIPKAAVVVVGFCVIQKPAFVLPAISSIFGIILEPILILFLFFKYGVFLYKTLYIYIYINKLFPKQGITKIKNKILYPCLRKFLHSKIAIDVNRKLKHNKAMSYQTKQLNISASPEIIGNAYSSFIDSTSNYNFFH